MKLLAFATAFIVFAVPLAGPAQQPVAASGTNTPAAPGSTRLSSPQAAGGSASVAELERTLVETIAHCEPSIVAITRTPAETQPKGERGTGGVFDQLRGTTNPKPITVGTGVIIDPAGLVLTHYLAVHDGDQHSITTMDRTTYAASIRAADPRSGLAVLAIDQHQKTRGANGAAHGSFPALRFGDATTLRKGQFVIAIGNPFAIQTDGQPTASWGIVTNLARKAPVGTNLNDAPGPAGDYRTTIHHLGTLIQTDAKLGFSTSGGALVNLRGELVGLTTTVAVIAGHEQPAGYAIPMNNPIRRIIETLKQGREAEYGMLGVAFTPLALESAATSSERLTIAEVFRGGPAANAGLASGDVITRVNDQPVTDVDAIQLAVGAQPPASAITVGYTRGGQPGTARVTLAKLAVAGKTIAANRPKSWLGIRVEYATALEAIELPQAVMSDAFDPQGCVLVSEVEENSVAWKAGVRKGMYISHVGGKRVSTPDEFRAAAEKLYDKFDIHVTQPIEPEAAKK